MDDISTIVMVVRAYYPKWFPWQLVDQIINNMLKSYMDITENDLESLMAQGARLNRPDICHKAYQLGARGVTTMMMWGSTLNYRAVREKARELGFDDNMLPLPIRRLNGLVYDQTGGYVYMPYDT